MNRETHHAELPQERTEEGVPPVERVADVPHQEGDREPRKKNEKTPLWRRLLPRRTVQKIMAMLLAGATTAGAFETRGQGQENTEPEEAAIAAVETEQPVDAEVAARAPVEWKGKTYDADEFDSMLLSEFQETLGSLADKCQDAEQCYYYYGGQVRMDTKPLTQLTGKSSEQLEWAGKVMRNGFVHEPGIRMSGTFVGMVEIGRSQLPRMPKETINDFYRTLYEVHRTTVADAYEQMRIGERSRREQVDIAEALGGMIEAETQEAVTEMEVSYGLGAYHNFETWFHEGVGDGLPSGETKWKKAHDERIEKTKALYTYLEKHALPEDGGELAHALTSSLALTRAGEAYHTARRTLFLQASEAAKDGWFTQEEARRWSVRALEEQQQLVRIEGEKKTFEKSGEELALAAQ